MQMMQQKIEENYERKNIFIELNIRLRIKYRGYMQTFKTLCKNTFVALKH